MRKRAITADDLLKMQFLGDTQISPDGKRLLFAKRHINDKNKYVTNLFMTEIGDKSQPKQWTQGEMGAGSGRWSPDGSMIAFVAGRDKPGAQIYVLENSGGEARKLTSLPEGAVGSILWSPDGKHIAFSFRESHPDRTEKARKERESKGLSDPPWEIDTLFYRMDGDGYFGGQRFKLYVCDVVTGEHRLLYDKDPLGHFSFDWKKDSSALVVSHSATKDPLLDKPNDQLYIVPLKGKATKIPCPMKGMKSSPKVSPDGKTIAYLGYYHPQDSWGVYNVQLWTIPMTGGDPKCLTADDDYCLDVLCLSDTLMGHTADGGGSGLVQWTNDGKSIYVSIGHNGAVDVAVVDAKKGGLTFVTQGKHVAMGSNISKAGDRMAMLWGNATNLMEVGWLDLAGKATLPQVVTSFNKALLEPVSICKPEEKWIPSTDGTKVHTWIMRPETTKKKVPAVLEIHGGPHAQYGWAFFHEFQLLCAQGYTVVYSNPRGSKGYGEAHCAAIRGDWGNKDWDDVSAVKEWMKKQAWIDTTRMGVMGGSYGGYMTNWAISHTHDFKAAITDRCIINWLSAGSNSDFPLNKDGYFGGQTWGAHEKIAKLWQQSPISHFEGVKTPTLIIHSEGDLRCNIEQGDQTFFVLKSLKVEARYVRYPVSTSHGLSRGGPPDLRLHRLGEIVNWWKRWL